MIALNMKFTYEFDLLDLHSQVVNHIKLFIDLKTAIIHVQKSDMNASLKLFKN